MQDTIHISGIGPLITPEEVAAWPLAPGWYVLSALIFLLWVFLVFRFVKKRKKNAYRREALRQLEKIEKLEQSQVYPADLAHVNRLLKITAMQTYTREKVASLSGHAWLEFLSNSSPCDFTVAPGNLIEMSGFQHSGKVHISSDQWSKILKEARLWVQEHR